MATRSRLCNLTRWVCLILAALVLYTIYPSQAFALEPGFVLEHLPRSFEGTFRWYRDSSVPFMLYWVILTPLVSLFGLCCRNTSLALRWILIACFFYNLTAIGILLWHFMGNNSSVDQSMSLIFLIGTGATSVRIARKIWEQEFDDGKGGQLLISINIILAILFFPSVFTTKNTAIEERQEVTINVPTSFLDQEGNIVADGKGRYLSIRGGPHDINIKIKISPESRRFEMWEIDPDKDSGFLTEGSHVGTISKDLKTIKAVWTTTGTGEQGELLLEAK